MLIARRFALIEVTHMYLQALWLGAFRDVTRARNYYVCVYRPLELYTQTHPLSIHTLPTNLDLYTIRIITHNSLFESQLPAKKIHSDCDPPWTTASFAMKRSEIAFAPQRSSSIRVRIAEAVYL